MAESTRPNTAVRLSATLTLSLLVIVLSVIPGQPQPGDSLVVWAVAATPTSLQKSLHLLFYAMLVMFWTWTIVSALRFRTAVIMSGILTTGLGMATEFAQTLIPGRFGSISDMLLNAAGVLTGLLIALAVRKSRKGVV